MLPHEFWAKSVETEYSHFIFLLSFYPEDLIEQSGPHVVVKLYNFIGYVAVTMHGNAFHQQFVTRGSAIKLECCGFVVSGVSNQLVFSRGQNLLIYTTSEMSVCFALFSIMTAVPDPSVQTYHSSFSHGFVATYWICEKLVSGSIVASGDISSVEMVLFGDVARDLVGKSADVLIAENCTLLSVVPAEISVLTGRSYVVDVAVSRYSFRN